jgi:hypothetical protein
MDGNGPVMRRSASPPPKTQGYSCHLHFMVLYLQDAAGRQGRGSRLLQPGERVRFTGDPGKTLFVSRNGAEFKAATRSP